MTRTLYRREEGLQFDLSVEEIARALRDPQGLLWVDLSGVPAEESRPLLGETFEFHPLAIDDALEETHVPRVDDWQAYLYIVLQSVALNEHEGELALAHRELDIFLGSNYVVTYHDASIPALERVWLSAQRGGRGLQGATQILYRLADELSTDYMPVVEGLDDAIDHIEDQIFNHPPEDILARIFAIKRAILELRRILSPQREAVNKLARDDYTLIAPRDRVYFRDVYDHLVRLYDINEGLRDLVSGALDTYLSVINNRMNDVMKTLTIITTLFMPISFLVGFFGMNFFEATLPLPAWTSTPAFILVLVIILLLPIAMFLWMRRRGWM
jgi:magnesium transporter